MMANHVFEQLICGKYKMCKLIGTGSFGKVTKYLTRFSHLVSGSTYAGYDISSGEEVAIKLELRSSSYFHLENESKVYKHLSLKCAAIPQLRWSGMDGEYSVVVLSLLGPSLERLFIGKGSQCTFTLPTVITIAEQLVCQRDSLCIFYVDSHIIDFLP